MYVQDRCQLHTQRSFCIQIFTSILHIDFQFEITRSLEVHQSCASYIHILRTVDFIMRKKQLMRKICSFVVSTSHSTLQRPEDLYLYAFHVKWMSIMTHQDMDRIQTHAEYVLIDLAGSRYFFRRFLVSVCVCVFLIKFMHKAQSLYIIQIWIEKCYTRCNASDAYLTVWTYIQTENL